MAGFKPLDGDSAVIYRNGVFRQEPLFERNGFLFIRSGGGFVKVYHDGSTSQPGLKVEELSTDVPLWKDRLGKVRTATGEGFKRIAAQPGADGETKLLEVDK